MVKRIDKYARRLGSPSPTIGPHSLVKHHIVRRYPERDIQVLMSNYTIGKLTLPVGDGYRANDDAWATGRAWNDFGEVDRFDAVLSQRCSGGRTEKLIPAICDSRSPTCAQWLDTIGSSTPTTADMEQQVLERVIRPGEILG